MDSSDLYAVVRKGLEADGWVVGKLQRKGLFEAERGMENLTVVIASGSTADQLTAGYKRLLKVLEANPSRRVAIVMPPHLGTDAADLKVEPIDLLKANIFVANASGLFYEGAAETFAAYRLPRGPAAWRNWRAEQEGFEANQRTELGFYSDSNFLDQLEGLGPMQVINTVSRVGAPHPGEAQQVLVLRHTWHLPRTPLLTGGDEQRTTTGTYYEGWVGDEISSLLSLALNVRCANGGIIRSWWSKEDLDGVGRPDTFFHHKPSLQTPQYGEPMIPWVARDEVNLEDARPFLEVYRALPETRAVVLVRAARQFQQALWIADESPSLAWLLLVGALETAASLLADEIPALELLREMRPDWAEVLEASEHPAKKKVIKEAARLATTLAKVRALVASHPLTAPPQPTEPYAIDWSDLTSLVEEVYDLRSEAVHAGLPLPAPMLDPPRPVMNPPAERPGGTVGSGDSVWIGEDLPMYLHTFARIVGGVLRSWWQSLDSGSTGASS